MGSASELTPTKRSLHFFRRCLHMSSKVLAEFSAGEILPLIAFNQKVQYENYCFRVGSLRLLTFKKNPKCCHCGLLGTRFRLELHSNQQSPHLNFYAVLLDNTYVLMTKDHITPKSRGGSDTLDNLQTLCVNCNHVKADKLPMEVNTNV